MWTLVSNLTEKMWSISFVVNCFDWTQSVHCMIIELSSIKFLFSSLNWRRCQIYIYYTYGTYWIKRVYEWSLINSETKDSRWMFVCLMVFNATFNNISVISWRSILLVEETGVPRENHRLVTSHWQILSHDVAHHTLVEIRTHNISGDRHWLIP
jgi:hypothetical protein